MISLHHRTPSKFQWASLIVLLILSQACTCPPLPESPRIVLDRIEGPRLPDGITTAVFKFENPTKLTVNFGGYSHCTPMMIVKQFRNHHWRLVKEDWCGTGAKNCVLSPGESVILALPLDDMFGLEPLPTRVGINVGIGVDEKYTTVWSDDVDLSTERRDPDS